MRKSVIKAKLKNNEPVLIPLLGLGSPAVFELASLMGFDGIWIDLEHPPVSIETAQNLMRAARVGASDILARPAKGEFFRMARLLEAGAQGIMYPRCDDAEEAAEVVRWAKFHPMGQRGIDGAGADMPYGTMSMPEYIEKANQETFIVIQIEDGSAVDKAMDIAAVEGVDVLFFGRADFTQLSGIPGQNEHPSVLEAYKAIDRAAKAHGKHWGTVALSAAHISELKRIGASFFCYGEDLEIIKSGLQTIKEEGKSLGFQYKNAFL